MNTLLSPQAPTAPVMMRPHVAATSEVAAHHSSGPATVGALRAARKHHRVRLSDPAQFVVTDFAEEQALTIAEDCGIEEASIAMFRWGAHALVALRDEHAVVGLLSSENLEGEHIRRFLDAHPGRASEDVRVRDLMMPCEGLPKLQWDTVRGTRVSDLLQIVEMTDCANLLIVEATGRTAMALRGLLSRTRLLRALEPSI